MMRDCENGDVRDQLPEYLHGMLDAETRALVESHLAACAVCTEELGFLRSARGAFSTPEVDLAAVTRAVTAAARRAQPTTMGAAAGARRWRVARWQVAAGVSFLLVGTISMQLLRQQNVDGRAEESMRDSLAMVTPGVLPGVLPAGLPSPSPMPAASGPAAETLTARRPKAAPASRGSAWSDLSDEQLQQLLNAIDGAEAVPGLEPEARMAPIMVPAGRTGRTGGEE
jgi:hypothetical protein